MSLAYSLKLLTWFALMSELTGLVPSRPSLAAGCAQTTSSVLVRVQREDAREVFDTVRSELTRLAKVTGSSHHEPIFGAYIAVHGYIFDFEDEITQKDGIFCASAVTLRVSLVLKDRTIHLAREIQDNACLREATRNHQLQHAKADDRAFAEAVLPLTEKLRASFRVSPGGEGASPAQARQRLEDALDQQIEVHYRSVEDERKRLDNEIDSPDNLKRLRLACANNI